EGVFANGVKTAAVEAEALQTDLYEQLGRLKRELEWLKKKSAQSPEQLRPLVEPDHPQLSVRRQCALLGLKRSSLYYEPVGETLDNLRLLRLLDAEYTAQPFRGSRRMTVWLRGQGEAVNRKRVQRLMRLMGLEAIYPKPQLSAPGQGHKVFPYLLRDVASERPDQVWSTDITDVPLAQGFMYLAAIIDWYSPYVIAWRLSNTLDGSFCLDLLEEALSRGRPEVFNTDQGVQFTAQAWTGRLAAAGVQVSMDGKGRCLDNVFVERLWRTVKYEDIYLRGYEGVPELHEGLERYVPFYNDERPHPSLAYQTPAVVYGQRA
ncbi:MAG TPA: IS3 family transposase, partial [Gemmataceae bacterium]|nr:IS3 family transposase [Gemmataceae bacterium]